jgi:phosphate transport system substrate-binding protein
MLAWTACDQTPRDPRVDDSPTFGHVAVLADEAFKPLLEDQQLVFNSTYPDAHVDIHYLPEAELAKAMLADSVRCVFAAFKPGGEQEAYFRTRSLSVHQEPIATDAIAVLVSPQNPVTHLTTDQLRGMLTGTITQWPGTTTPVTVLFDRPGSGVPRTLVDSLLGGQATLSGKVFALNGAQELVERVGADPGAIGFLSFTPISDLDDPACRALRAPVRILPIAASDTARAFPPDQGTLKDGSYPLRRKVNMMVTEGRSGLGTGFASFVAGHKGQRIILKQGLAPERVPARDVELVH